MKILFITSLLGKEYGGAEVSMRLLREKLIAEGCEVPALTTRKSPSDKTITSISYPFEVPKKLITLGNGQIDYFLARKIKKQLEVIKPNIIHVQDTYILPATVIANKSLKIPIVATIRNSVLDKTWEQMFPKPIPFFLKKRNKKIINALHKIDYVISVSEYIKIELIERGIDGEKIIPIYNLPPTFTVNELIRQRNPTSAVHLFAPGLLASFKGFSVLINAMKSVVENNPNVNLIIAGDGPQSKSLKKLTNKNKLDHCITFAGKIPFAKLAEQYSNCDIVVFPSIYPEPFGRVALEALYFGKPVVASRVGGIPEVVNDGTTGLLVSPENTAELANAIISLVNNPQLRDSIGKNGKSIIKDKFSTQAIVDKHLRLYKETNKD